jgi:hypothetical protein
MSNGYTLGADGRLIRFNAILVGDDGRVERLMRAARRSPIAPGSASTARAEP